MPRASSHRADPRRPVYSGSRRIPGLFVHERADGTVVFTARLRQDGGEPKRAVLDARNQTEAIRELEELRVDRRRGDPVRTGSLVPTFREVAESWLAHLELRVHSTDPRRRYSPRTVTLHRQRMHKHVLPRLGARDIDQITVRDLRRLIDQLSAIPLSGSTVVSILNNISAVFRQGVREGLVERNIVRDLDRDDRPSTARQSEPRYITPADVERLLALMTDTFRPVASACAYAGLRISEVLGLHWRDVDFDAGTIHVHRQLNPENLTVRNVTKTPASTAVVPLLPGLARELKAHRSRQAERDLRRVHRDALVFTTSRGRPQSKRNALRALHAAGDAAGLNPDGVEKIGLHDLRHSYVAIALDSNATLAEAAVLARHANARVTAQVYAGVTDEAKAKIASKLIAGGFGA
jgi:integrase